MSAQANSQSFEKINQTNHASRILCCTFAHNSDTLVSASDDRSIKLWNWGGRRSNTPASNFSCAKLCLCLDFSKNDSFFISGHKDGKVRIWDANQRKVAHTCVANPNNAEVVDVKSFGHGSRILALNSDSTLSELDTRKLNEPLRILEHEDFMCNGKGSRLSLSNNERYAVTASSTNQLCVFDLHHR